MGSKMMLFGQRVQIPRHPWGVKVKVNHRGTMKPGQKRLTSAQRNSFNWLQKVLRPRLRIPSFFPGRTQEKS